jgi:hypothetical protein
MTLGCPAAAGPIYRLLAVNVIRLMKAADCNRCDAGLCRVPRTSDSCTLQSLSKVARRTARGRKLPVVRAPVPKGPRLKQASTIPMSSPRCLRTLHGSSSMPPDKLRSAPEGASRAGRARRSAPLTHLRAPHPPRAGRLPTRPAPEPVRRRGRPRLGAGCGVGCSAVRAAAQRSMSGRERCSVGVGRTTSARVGLPRSR